MIRYFDRIFRTLRLVRYKQLFSSFTEKQEALSATDACSLEIIYLLNNPTVNEFANFISISQPSASYRLSSLESKGLIEKTPCVRDKRESKIKVTDKFRSEYISRIPAWEDAVKRVMGRYTKEETKMLKRFLLQVAAETQKLEEQPLE